MHVVVTRQTIKSTSLQVLEVDLFVGQVQNLMSLNSVYFDSLCLNFVHLLARKPNLEKNSIYSNKSTLICPWLQVSGLARTLLMREREKN